MEDVQSESKSQCFKVQDVVKRLSCFVSAFSETGKALRKLLQVVMLSCSGFPPGCSANHSWGYQQPRPQ